jgi:glycosyltransferase involved in cell wall biosynthesis
MLITVVTPTLNAIAFLKEAIESVRVQNAPNVTVEHVIVDGGSNDGTVELAESYGLRVITGKDKGIFDAINKGSFRSSGELLGFLGADDVMLEGALADVADAYTRSGRQWVCGGIRLIDGLDRNLGEIAALPSWVTASMHASMGWGTIAHMSTYVSRELYTALNGFDISFPTASDYDFFCRARAKAPYARLGHALACFRQTGENYSVRHLESAEPEFQRVRDTFAPTSPVLRRFYRSFSLWRYARNPGWASRRFAAQGRFPFTLMYGRVS